MRVKELLLHALERANHIEDGVPADARELTKARKHFASALSKYSSSNLITAFQRMCDVEYAEKQVIGRYNLKRGKVMHEAQTRDALPDPTKLTVGKDFGHTLDDGKYLKVGEVMTLEGLVKVWMASIVGDTPEEWLADLGCCDYVPDKIVTDMERVMACMYRMKGQTGSFSKMDFIPLVDFYADVSKTIYNASPVGENKVELLLPSGLENYDFKLVYYTKMEVKDDDYIELPEAYKELLTLAVTVGLLSEDADSDPKQLANYSAQLTSMEDLVGATNVTTRRLTREPDGNCLDSLHTGAFIRRRFGR
jgi:hypothetical protein